MINKHSPIFLGKHSNKPHVLSTTEHERLIGILDSPVGEDFFTIKEVLESKFFHRCFRPIPISMASNSGDNGEDIPSSGAASVTDNEGQSYHFRDEPRRDDQSRDGSVEYIGTIRKEMRKVLPRLPNLTLLRLLGEKV